MTSAGETPDNVERVPVTIDKRLFDRMMLFRDLFETSRGEDPDRSERFMGKLLVEFVVDDAVAAYLDEVIDNIDTIFPEP